MPESTPKDILTALAASHSLAMSNDENAFVQEQLLQDVWHKKELNEIYNLEAKYMGGTSNG